MRRFLLVGVGWLIFEAVLLRGAVAFLPADPSLLHFSETAPAFVRADLNPDEVLFKENSSFSQELSLLCKQENEQSCTRAPVVDSLLQGREKDGRWSLVHTRVASLATLFFPRKLCSSSAEDGPFLS